MTTRTFTVTVVNVSGNNKYFIDGVQQATVNLAEELNPNNENSEE